jgi:hypothetical protein
MSEFIVPTFDPHTRECSTVIVSATNEHAAVGEALRAAPNLRFTGGAVERFEMNPDKSVKADPWAERHRPVKEQVR